MKKPLPNKNPPQKAVRARVCYVRIQKTLSQDQIKFANCRVLTHAAEKRTYGLHGEHIEEGVLS